MFDPELGYLKMTQNTRTFQSYLGLGKMGKSIPGKGWLYRSQSPEESLMSQGAGAL